MRVYLVADDEDENDENAYGPLPTKPTQNYYVQLCFRK